MGVPAPQGVSASGLSPYGKTDQANAVLQGTLGALGPTRPFAFYGPMDLAVWGEYTTTLTTANGSLSSTVAAAGPIAAGVSVSGANVPRGTVGTLLVGTTLTLTLPTLTYYAKSIAGVPQLSFIMDTSRLLGATVGGLGLAGTETVTAIPLPSVLPNPDLPNGIRGTATLSAAPTVSPPSVDHVPFTFALSASGAVLTGADAAATFTGAAIGLVGSVQLERSFDGGATWIVCNVGSTGTLAQWSTAAPVSIAFGEPERQVLYRLNLISVTPVAGIALRYRISETGQAAMTLSVPTI